MKWISRKILRHAIIYHERMRKGILFERGQNACGDNLWNKAAAELRCADRIRKLLKKYQ